MARPSSNRNRPPLDEDSLRAIALHYVGRYATTRAKLAAYLDRKLRERGWTGEGAPPTAALIERFAGLGYVDDRAFAAAREQALARRGYGRRRRSQALSAAGIEAEDRAAVIDVDEDPLESALAFARRRRIGPFARVPMDEAARRRAFAALLRAGHDPRTASAILAQSPEAFPE